jgi:MFS family permease
MDRIPGLRAIVPMIAGTAIMCAGNGLLTTVVGLTLIRGGVDPEAVQPIVTGYPLGFLVGCLTARQLIIRLGHARAFATLVLLEAAASIGFTLSFHAWVWVGLRIVDGFCIAGCFTTVESWVNLNADTRSRGTLIGLYMVSTTLGLSLGQTLLNLANGIALFGIAIAVLCLSPLPLALGPRKSPSMALVPRTIHEPMGMAAFLLIAPLAILAAAQAGMTNLNFVSVAPIYGAMIGLTPAEAGELIIAFSLGGLFAQPVVGILSDRFDRRALLTGTAGLSATLCFIIAISAKLPLVLLLLVLVLFGAFTLAIYPLALALAASRVPASLVVSMSSKFLLIYSLGSVVSPAISTLLMQRVAPQAMFGFLGCLIGTVAVCSVIDLMYSARRPM